VLSGEEEANLTRDIGDAGGWGIPDRGKVKTSSEMGMTWLVAMSPAEVRYGT
jgi:hypothetical protein